MRKLIKYTFFLLALIVVSSCAKNDDKTTAQEAKKDMANVNMTMVVDTKADNDNLTKAGGDSKVPVGYALRCIVEIYAKDNFTTPVNRKVTYPAFNADDRMIPTIDFSINIPTGTYVAVCWVDYVTAQGLTAFYKADMLTKITQGTVMMGSEADDAYTAVSAPFDVTSEGVASLAITVKRPLARIELQNVLFTNENTNEAYYNADASIKMMYTNTIYSEYNARSQKCITSGETRDYSIFHLNKMDATSKQITVTDYVFVDDAGLALGIYARVTDKTVDTDYYLKGGLINGNIVEPNTKVTIKAQNGGALTLNEKAITN